jgi:hypothetical protein
LEDGKVWHRVIDTLLAPGEDFLDPGKEIPIEGQAYIVGARSCIVLKSKSR